MGEGCGGVGPGETLEVRKERGKEGRGELLIDAVGRWIHEI